MRSWPLLVLAVPAAAEVWSGWVGIAQQTGFGTVPLLPGIWSSLRLDTAVTLPVGVECYAAYAPRAWLATGHAVSDRTRRFARRPAICSLALGMAGQVKLDKGLSQGLRRPDRTGGLRSRSGRRRQPTVQSLLLTVHRSSTRGAAFAISPVRVAGTRLPGGI
jgi:hypothetical protein